MNLNDAPSQTTPRPPHPRPPAFRRRTWPYQVMVLPFIAERHVSVRSRRSPVCVYLQVPHGLLSRCVGLF